MNTAKWVRQGVFETILVGIFLLVWSTNSFAQERTDTVTRPNGTGDGIEVAPTITFTSKRAGQNGETFLVQAAAKDHDGGPVTMEAYVNGTFFTKRSREPFAFFIGPDVYKQLPFTVELIARDDFGNATRAQFAITSVLFSGSLDCTFSGPEVTIVGNNVEVSQVGNSGGVIDYTSTNVNSGEEAQVNATFQTSGTSASGVVVVTRNNSATTFNMSGTVEIADDGVTVTRIELADDVNSNTFICE